MTVTEAPRHSDRIPTLDGLRAVAIIIVLISHVFHASVAPLGHMGVLIFFALSGYLITTRLLAEYHSSGRICLRDFYLRRAFRILPSALVYLAVIAALSALGLAALRAQDLRAALFFYMNYIEMGRQGWLAAHFWSLSVEEHFYLFWPCLLLIFGVAKGWAHCGVPSACHWRMALCGLRSPPPCRAPFPARLSVQNGPDCGHAAVGLLPRLPKTASEPGRVDHVRRVLCGAARGAVRGDATPPPPDLRMLIEHLLPTVLVGAVVACPAAPIGRLLDLAPVRIVGRLSYSLYIWQQLFLLNPRVSAPVGIAAAFVCAYLSYRFVEQPCIRMGQRLMASRQPGGTGAIVEIP